MGRKILYTWLGVLLWACGGDARRELPPSADRAGISGDPVPVVLFLGTSLTAGLGLPQEEAYPSLIQQKIHSGGLNLRVVNAGVSGETSAGALRRIDWLLRLPIAVLVLESGANDALRGQDISVMQSNLQEIVDRAVAKYENVRIVIAGMQAPPNLGGAYTAEFSAVFTDLAAANSATLIPFLLAGVAGVRELNQSDGIHPTGDGHRIIAENIWSVLAPVLRDLERSP